MGVDSSRIDQAFITPDFVKQTVARLHASTSENERVEEREFDAGEIHRFAIHRHVVTCRIDRDAAGGYVLLFSRVGFPPAQDRLDPEDDFPRTEGLCYIIIRPKFQTDYAVN